MLGIFLDIETNGLDPFEHAAIEIALEIVDVRTGVSLDSFESIVAISESSWKKSHSSSLAVNGLSFAEIAKGKSTATIKKNIEELFAHYKVLRGKAVFICQNPSFDRPFFRQFFTTAEQEEKGYPYHWLDLASMFWAISLKEGKYPWELGYSKDLIAKAYNLPSESKPHRAMNGVHHLLACYKALVGFPNPI